MYEILMIVYLVVAVALVGFILIQHGKGAGMGASFGSGASGTVFGASGSGNFLTKTTTILAIVFFGVALALGNLTTDQSESINENSLFPEGETEQSAATDIPAEDVGDLPVEQATGDLPVDPEGTAEKAEKPVKDNVAGVETSGKAEDDTDKKDGDN